MIRHLLSRFLRSLADKISSPEDHSDPRPPFYYVIETKGNVMLSNDAVTWFPVPKFRVKDGHEEFYFDA